MKVLLVSSESAHFSNLESAILDNEAVVARARSGQDVILEIADRSYDLVIADEHLPDMTGLELARKVVLINPMVNIAVASSLSQEDFHEASEGLGILMQLSPDLRDEEIGILLRNLKGILQITGNTHKPPGFKTPEG
ncbi:MAG: response regulator [Prochlorococcaceae cyanobacterium]